MAYLHKLAEIVSGPDFEGYWHELAVNLFDGFQPFLRIPSRATSVRRRLRDTLGVLRELRYVWRARDDKSARSQLRADRHALATLNIVRCESHRWAIETALSVLTGECADLRTPQIRANLATLGRLSGPPMPANI